MLDLSLNDDIFVESTIDAAIQELDLLFGTLPTELLGDFRFGSNFLQFLWSLTPMENSLRNYVIDRINGYTVYVSSLRYDINVKKYDDIAETVYAIEIILYDSDETTYSKTYMIKA